MSVGMSNGYAVLVNTFLKQKRGYMDIISVC